MTKFHMKLVLRDVEGQRSSERDRDVSYAPDLSDVTSIIDDICEDLHDLGVVGFSAGGFGQNQWPVDVWTDLPVVLGQINGVLEALLVDGDQFELQFYEQGLERALAFQKRDADYVITCRSWGGWQPSPDPAKINRQEIIEMCCDLEETFMSATAKWCDDLYGHAWMEAWTDSPANWRSANQARATP